MMKVKVTNISVNEGATICINFLKCHSVSLSQDQNRKQNAELYPKLYLKSIESSLVQNCRYICTYILGSAEGKLNI